MHENGLIGTLKAQRLDFGQDERSTYPSMLVKGAFRVAYHSTNTRLIQSEQSIPQSTSQIGRGNSIVQLAQAPPDLLGMWAGRAGAYALANENRLLDIDETRQG